MQWIKRRLAVRQTVYAMIVAAAATVTISVIEVAIAFDDESERQSRFIGQISDAYAATATRAAYHVDVAQATAVLGGMMSFESLAQARITTDLGEVLAERSRTIQPAVLDPISQWLFRDGSSQERILTTATSHVPVGTLALSVSPELVGQEFASTVGAIVGGLVIEFILIASALAVIFHRTLVKPLTTYAANIEAVDHDAVTLPQIEVPRAHEQDEFGRVISQTNGLLARISEQREALIHREKIAALGAMLTGAAHELNNPLAVIDAQAQMLKDNSNDISIQARADKILRPTARCAKIVRSFLEVARHREAEKAPLDMNTVIGDAVDLVDYQLEAHGVLLDTEIGDDVPTIIGDAVLLSQAVMNLIMNAQQAMADQIGAKTIHLTVEMQDNFMVIAVRDNGTGIPKQIRERIVEPFFTTKSQLGGTGLGLAFCNHVAISHGGYLDFIDAPSAGTLAKLVIAAERADPQSTAVKMPIAKSSLLRVLLVDDEPGLAEIIAEALEFRGHSVTTQFDATSALTSLAKGEFDVVVADIRMPNIDGTEFFETATRRYPYLRHRFVFVSGEPVSDQTASFMDAHELTCLSKPIDISKLAMLIDSHSVIEVTQQ